MANTINLKYSNTASNTPTLSGNGEVALNQSDLKLFFTNSAAQVNFIYLDRLENIQVAASDETTDLTTGTAKITFRMPYAFTVTTVRASVNTAPTGSTIIVDINEAGASILGTKLSIDASEKTSTTAASAATITDASLADDAEMTIDIDQVGSTVPGKGLKIILIGKRT